jgi:hypothetical protein
MPVFNNQAQNNEFKRVLTDLYAKNEAPRNSWYIFSDATLGKSGYSFGQAQWDVKTNPGAKSFLLGIGFSQLDIDKLSKAKPMSVADLSNLNSKLALQISAVDQFFSQHLDADIRRIENIVAELSLTSSGVSQAVAEKITGDRMLQVAIIDFSNQFNIVGIDKDGQVYSD